MITRLTLLLVAAVLAGCGQETPPDSSRDAKTPDRTAPTPLPAPTPAVAEKPAEDPSTMEILGTVRFKDLEGGFYAIDADDGGKYEPMDLPEAFQRNGLRVRLKARPVTDMMSFRMYGQIIEVLTIEER